MSGEGDWLPARAALYWVAAALGDEWAAMEDLRRLAREGKVKARGKPMGTKEGSVELPALFWTRCGVAEGYPLPVEDWEHNRFNGRAVTGALIRASSVEFASEDLENICLLYTSPSPRDS